MFKFVLFADSERKTIVLMGYVSLRLSVSLLVCRSCSLPPPSRSLALGIHVYIRNQAHLQDMNPRNPHVHSITPRY